MDTKLYLFLFVLCTAGLSIYLHWTLKQVFEPDDVRGKHVVITGASTGIGEQMAYQYAKYGANLLITARREPALMEVVAKCKRLGAQSAHYIALDMSKPSDIERLVEETNRTLHRLDHLILNHVSYGHMGPWDGDVERLSQVMKVNFESYVSLASLAIPLLEESSGSIGVVSSAAGLCGGPYIVSYASSKYALAGFFNSIRQEFILAKKNISITLCLLGSIKTPNAIASDKYYKAELRTSRASDTAYAIIQGVTLREREVYFPWFSVRLMSLLRDWFPDFIDSLVRQSLKEDGE